MDKEINRKELLERLTASKGNNFVKIITGIRRCGKSYLLFNIFKKHLLASGVPASRIIEIDLEKPTNKYLANPIALDKYIRKRISKSKSTHYILIDEIQSCHKVLPEGVDISKVHPDDRESCYITFYSVLNGLRTEPNIDIYVTGSNSKMLSSDVATEFRGRGQVIYVTPLSFCEFRNFRGESNNQIALIEEYMQFGGLPDCVLMDSVGRKKEYLINLYNSIYIRDVVERNKIKDETLLEKIIDITMSTVGSLTNPTKLANTITTITGLDATRPTVAKYLKFLEDAFIVAKANRYDVKGKHYLDYPLKYYATDTGLRNARLNFRQVEPTHLMENIIYCELQRRGYAVDIGVVEKEVRVTGKHEVRRYEVDFVVSIPPRTIYIQSAYHIPDKEKRSQETASLLNIKDNFPKIIIVNDPFQARTIDDSGITYISLFDFLTDLKCLESV